MGRFFGLVYGFAVYALLLAAFTYAIFFITGVLVPKDIDGGVLMPPFSAAAVNIGLFSILVIQYAAMTRDKFKLRLTKIVPRAIERSTFVLAFTLGLTLLLWQWRPMPGTVWLVSNEAGRIIIYGIAVTGWAVMLISTFLINHFRLFGVQQVTYHFLGRQMAKRIFTTPGPYQFCRHPMLLGFVVALWAAPHMTYGRLLFAAAAALAIPICIYFEERERARSIGAIYKKYQRKVPMLFPRPARRWSAEADLEAAG